MRFTLSLTLLLQAALLLVTLEQAPAAIASFEQKRLIRSEDDSAILDSWTISSDPTAPSYDVEFKSGIPTVFENADDTVLVARSKVDDDDDDEDEEYDELEIITVFLPNDEPQQEGALQRRASPTVCPPNATVRRSSALQTNANAKRANVAVTTTSTKTVTVTKTIYETVYRRCTQYIKRATTTSKHSSTKPATTSTKKSSASAEAVSTKKRTSTTSKKHRSTSKPATTSKVSTSTTSKAPSTSSKATSSSTSTTSSKTSTTSSSTSTTSSKPSTTSTTTSSSSTTSSKPSTTSTSTTSTSTTSTTTTSKTTSSTTSSTSTSTSSSTSTSTTSKTTSSSSSSSSTTTSSTTSSKPSSTSTTSTSTRSSTTSSSTTTTTTPRALPTTTSTTTSRTSSSSTTTTSSTPTPKVYSLVANYAGNNFYKNMYFFTYNDPTNGLVDYIGQSEASSLGMIKTTSGGQVYMGYATTRVYPPVTTSSSTPATTKTATSTSVSATGSASITVKKRATTSKASNTTSTSSSASSTSTTAVATPYMKAVRVSSFDTFTTGVFILDASHMPVGCGTWPAWWTVPTNPAGGWPNGGEIDIVEGISYTSQNTYSVHTAHGCTVNSTSNSQLGSYQLQNKTLATNCASFETSNQGCGVQSSLRNDFGVGYNNMGGGIHAMVWDADLGIKSYFWKRSQVPADVTAGTPDPSKWGTPQGSWPAANCDPNTFFFNHVSVFTNTICGDWAGDDYLWRNAFAGQTQSCAQKTGFSTCKAYVQSTQVDFSDAYWLINSVKIYQTTRTY